MANAAINRADMAALTTTTPAAPDEPESIAKAALTDSSHTMPPETPLAQVATASTRDPLPNDDKNAVSAIWTASPTSTRSIPGSMTRRCNSARSTS
jgi:hypothetical protein